MREALPKSQINAAPPRIFAEGPSFVLTVLVALGFACWDVPLVWSSSAAPAVIALLRPYVLGMRLFLSLGGSAVLPVLRANVMEEHGTPEKVNAGRGKISPIPSEFQVFTNSRADNKSRGAA